MKKIFSAFLTAVMMINMSFIAVLANESAFELIRKEQSDALGGMVYYYKHKKTGAEVVYNDNNSDKREFVLGFKTPPVDSKGANHVLEHALFCGSEKYPTKNIMHYIQNGTSSLMLNGVTADDCTYYMIMTENQNEYYNMIDVYMNGIFHPLFLTDENIFRQQGIRVEYENGKARYNGVVYNELRIKNLNTDENSVNFLADKLYRAIYGDTTPSFSAGGELDAIKELTYEDLLRVYNTFYIPSNSMTYLSGKQDLDKTFNVLDGFFSEIDTKAPHLSFEDTKQVPAKQVQEYNISENTKTVDIGFMYSGPDAAADPKDTYAVEILYDIIRQKMEEKGYTDMYTSGGRTGGVSNLALMISRVPIEDKDQVIADYNAAVADLAENGIDEKDIDQHVENDDRYLYQNFDRVMIGLLYKHDPLAYTETGRMREYYREHKEYFSELLKEYYTENPCHVTIVSGNGVFTSEDSSVNVNAQELEKIKEETERFREWNDAEDDPAVIAKIPFLSLDEVKDAPQTGNVTAEEENGISFYYTKKDGDTEASVYFPLTESDVDYAHLMYEFWQYQADKSDGGFYASIRPFANASHPDQINPHYYLWISGDNQSESLKSAVSMLQSEQMWNTDDLKEYISSTPKKIFDSYYDPYFLSSELKGSALSAEGRFSVYIPENTIVKGSPHYYQFLRGLDPNDAQSIMQRIRAIADKMIRVKPVIEYIGDADSYEQFKKTVLELFADAESAQSVALRLPAGYNSAATITKLADANHFMLAANYDGHEYSGKMTVLGKVLSTKYITPTMRGKHGAYGCHISFREDEMVSAVTGLSDVDLAIGVWQGMGDYLRNLSMTQNELNSFIISAVQEYDEWDYKSAEYGANFALREKSANDCEKIRNEMLSTTVEDIKGYADFVDELTAQGRVFAVLGKTAAENAKFPFAYYADADTLEITPKLKKNAGGYIGGRENNTFAPDAYITRGEVAAIISRLMMDDRPAKYDSGFTDVSDSDWYYDAVREASEKGIMSGYGGGVFQPQKNITRAELAAVLSSFVFQGDATIDAVYSDMSENDWFYESMAKLVNAGILTGYEDGTIRPDASATRAEVVAMINRMIGGTTKNGKDNPFTDVTMSHWCYDDIIFAALEK